MDAECKGKEHTHYVCTCILSPGNVYWVISLNNFHISHIIECHHVNQHLTKLTPTHSLAKLCYLYGWQVCVCIVVVIVESRVASGSLPNACCRNFDEVDIRYKSASRHKLFFLTTVATLHGKLVTFGEIRN